MKKALFILSFLMSLSLNAQAQSNVSLSDVTETVRQLTFKDIEAAWNDPNSFPGCRSQIIARTQSTYLLTDMTTGVQVLIGSGQREGGINILGGNGAVVCAKTKNNVPVIVSPIYKNGYGENYVNIYTPTRAGKITVFLKINGNIATLQTGYSPSQKVKVENVR